MAAIKLTKRTVDAADPRAKEYTLFDSELTGFGLQVRPSGHKSFVAIYRAKPSGGTAILRKITLGSYSMVFTPEQARQKAKSVLGAAAMGEDPAAKSSLSRKEITVAQLCDLYLQEGCETKKPSTLATDRGRIERHIKPLLGRKRIGDVNRGDIERCMKDISTGKTAADIKTKFRGRAIVESRRTHKPAQSDSGGIFTFAVGRSLLEQIRSAGSETSRQEKPAFLIYQRAFSPRRCIEYDRGQHCEQKADRNFAPSCPERRPKVRDRKS